MHLILQFFHAEHLVCNHRELGCSNDSTLFLGAKPVEAPGRWLAEANRNIQPAPKYVNLHLPEWFCIGIFSSWPSSLVPRALVAFNNIVSSSGALLISIVLLEAQYHLTWAGFANTTHSQHSNPCAHINKPCWILVDSMGICLMVAAIRGNTSKRSYNFLIFIFSKSFWPPIFHGAEVWNELINSSLWHIQIYFEKAQWWKGADWNLTIQLPRGRWLASSRLSARGTEEAA